jgi:hypothetical protein
MVLSLSIENFWNLIGEAEADGLQLGYSIPASLGQGYYREIELSPEMTLSFYDYDFAEDIELTVPVHEHLVQCMVLTAGAWDCDIYPEFGRSCAYLSGSGMSMAYADRHFQHQRTTGIDIEFEPAFVGRLLGEAEQMALTRRRFLQQEDWKQSEPGASNHSFTLSGRHPTATSPGQGDGTTGATARPGAGRSG